jgi:tRNA threonylcarbamoyladenosine biosynthesis protein TsaB
MALLLSIDTALETATICLSNDGEILGAETNKDPKSHGSFLQPAIKRLFSADNIAFTSIDAVAIVNGPGSYTGLRVGLASAKGLCFALNKPLIALNTLEVLALSALSLYKENYITEDNDLFCPLIDARRMEVFTAMYKSNLENTMKPQAIILDEHSFSEELENSKIIFSGNGHPKLRNVLNHPNAIFLETISNIEAIITIAENLLIEKKFSNLAYAEPFYIKDVFFVEKSKI